MNMPENSEIMHFGTGLNQALSTKTLKQQSMRPFSPFSEFKKALCYLFILSQNTVIDASDNVAHGYHPRISSRVSDSGQRSCFSWAWLRTLQISRG